MATTYLTRTVTGSSTTTATYSAWVKRTGLGEKNLTAIKAGSDQCRITFTPSDELQVFMHDGSYQYRKVTDRVFRDTSAFYNIVIAFDSTEGAAGDRIKIYINGVQETAFNNVTDPGSSDDCFWFQSATGYLGIEENGSSNGFDGLMTHINMIQGTAYAASDFGEFDSTSGIWKIKTAPSVTYGSQGFFLKMETTSGSGMGTDSSGNGNNYAENGTPTQTVDNPSSVMATCNSLNTNSGSNAFTNGNTKQTVTGNWLGISATMAVDKGKFYWELKNSGGGNLGAGVGKEGVNGTNTVYFSTGNNWLFDQSTNYGYYRNGSGTQKANNNTTTTYGITIASGEILMIAWDADNGKLFAGRNGTWFDSSDPANGTSPMYTITIGSDFWYPIFVAESNNIEINFGNGYFGTTIVSSAGTSSTDDDSIWEYNCPTGFYGLNTKNINTYG